MKINRRMLIVLVSCFVVVGVIGMQLAVPGVYQDYTYSDSVPTSITSPVYDEQIDSDTVTIQFNIPTDAGELIIYTSWSISIADFEEKYGTQSGTELGSQSATFTMEVSGYYTVRLEVYGRKDIFTMDDDGQIVLDTTLFTNVYYRRFYSQIVVIEVTQTVTTTVIPEPVTIITEVPTTVVTTITEEGETITSTIVSSVVSTIITTVDRTIVETLEIIVTRTITGESTSSFGLLVVLISIFLIIPIRRRRRMR